MTLLHSKMQLISPEASVPPAQRQTARKTAVLAHDLQQQQQQKQQQQQQQLSRMALEHLL
jgi:hypothetical protein